MLMLLLQTFLILLSAFLAGATLACLMKRVFLGEPVAAVEMIPATAAAAAVTAATKTAVAPVKAAEPKPAGDRFEQALAGAAPVAPAPAAAKVAAPAAPVVEVQKPAVAERPAPPPPPPAPPAPPVAAEAPAPQPAPTPAPVAPIAAAAVTAAAAMTPALEAAFASLSMDDLTRIKGVDAVVQSRINALGVRRYWQIAGWSDDDVNRTTQSLGFAGRIGDEDWIGQARVLAAGAETDYATRRRLGLPEPEEIAAAEAAAVAKAAEAAKAAQAAQAAEAAKAAAATDAAKSSALGIAAATAAAAAASAPAPTPAPAPAAKDETTVSEPRSDLTHLRSVRSEALRADPVAAPAGGRAGGAFDDLKRIRGVGVLIEKKLNSLAVTTYEQVANWTSADIDRVSQLLDFKGRIERENWVEQARILASGGQTEFSRRVDRGEVDSSR